MSFAPLIYWIVFGAAMAYYCVKYPLYRNKISYICLMASIFGIVASVFSILVVAWDQSTEQPAYYIFYGLYSTFAFLPPIVAFYTREKRMKQSNAGKYTTYFGFLWAAGCILGSLATTIMAAIVTNLGYSSSDGLIERLTGGLIFVLVMNWGFIAVIILFVIFYVEHFTQKHALSSFLAYVLLNVLSVLLFTILAFAPLEFDFFTIDTLGYLTIFLVDLPTTVSVFIAFHMGHLWIGENHSNLINNDVRDTHQYSNGANANTNDGTKYEVSNSV